MIDKNRNLTISINVDCDGTAESTWYHGVWPESPENLHDYNIIGSSIMTIQYIIAFKFGI